MSELAVGDEVRLLEILQHDNDLRLVQDLSVSRLQGLRQLRNRLTGNVHIANAPQRHETVRLHRDRLVEFWA